MGLEGKFLNVKNLASDMNLKPKDLTNILATKKIESKATTIDPAAFGILFEELTRAHQVEDIGAYLDGETIIPSSKPKAVAPKAEAPKAEAPKAETPKAEAPKAEAPKAEAPKAEAPKAEAPKAEAPKAEVPKAEAPKAEAPKAEAPKAAAPKAEAPKAAEPAKAPAAPATPAAPAKRPVYNIPAKAISKTPGSAPAQGNRPPLGQGPKPFPSRNQQNGAPQGQRPFNGQGGQGRPFGNNQNRPQGNFNNNRGNRPSADATANMSPVAKSNAELLAEMNLGRYGAPKPNARNQKKPQNKGNFGNQNRFDNDKDFGGSSTQHEKYKAPEIVRGASTASARGATRVIDTRSSSVDINKFDRTYDDFAPEVEDDDVRTSPQKVKKQTGSTNMGQKPGKGKNGKKQKMIIPKQQITVALPEEIVVSDLASRLKVTAGEVVKHLMGLGMMATVNETIDYDTAALVSEELGAIVTKEVVVTIEDKLFDNAEDAEEDLIERAPVVCVMGHVDHGKTSLLDAIRNAHVTDGEAGGITQHIGAYRVNIHDKNITFLDTPGHEAFTAMRARGAMATDIAILVVAADDGIMPQTIEAINHAKAAGVDIIVAINKMDKPSADPDSIKQELTKYDLVPEEWGGDVMCVPVSAKTHMGIDDLLEDVLLVAEVKELKANPNRMAKGLIIESRLDKGFGPVATVLVQNGTLHSGDVVIAGTAVGRVRVMRDSTGRSVKEAGPSVPVEIVGLADVPQAGDEFAAVADERMARELAEQRKENAKQEVFKANARANLDDLFSQINEGVKDLAIIVKADVDGSVEAVKQSLLKLSNEEVRVRVIHAAAGGITEGDVMLAAASNAIIVGFNVRPDKTAMDSADRQGVEIRTYRIIYECIEEITAAMKGMLAPKFKEVIQGHAEVRQVIHVPNVGFIAGAYVQDGKITRQSKIRVLRDGIVIFEDKVASLRRFKDDVKEVLVTYECGIGLEKFNDMKPNDILEAFTMEEITED